MQRPAASITCALTPAGSAASLRCLFRDEPTGELDSGWRIGVPGEELAASPPAGTIWLTWLEALEREPLLRHLGHAAPGTRYVIRREAGREPEVRDGRSGLLVLPGSPVAPGGGAAGSPFIAELAERALAVELGPALARAVAADVAEALWGCAFLVPTDRASGTPLVQAGAVTALADEASALAWQAGFAIGESAPALQFMPFSTLAQQAPLGAAGMRLLTAAGEAGVLDLAAAREEATHTDSEALMALRAHDADALAEMVARRGRVWITLRDAADPHGAPLRVRDHQTGASLLPLFASWDHAAAYDDLAEPSHVSLDELREAWEPETGIILGLGSPHAPIELGWGRLRASGFAQAPGASPWSAPAPGAHPTREEPPAVRPVPLPAHGGAWEDSVGPTERAIIDAVLELPKIPIDAAFVLVSVLGERIELAVAYVVDGQAHSAAHVCGGSAGQARVALFRLRVLQLLGPWLNEERRAGRSVPAQLRLQVLPGSTGGALSHSPLAVPLSQALTEWLHAQRVPVHECLPAQAVVGADPSHVSLAQAAASGDRRAAVRSLESGAALWVVLDAAARPLMLSVPHGGWALACFSSREAAVRFAPAGRPERVWSEAMAQDGAPAEALVIDPGATRAPLLLARSEVAWPAVAWGRNGA